jgi:predicted DNA-binding protein
MNPPPNPLSFRRASEARQEESACRARAARGGDFDFKTRITRAKGRDGNGWIPRSKITKALTLPIHRSRLANMEVRFRPETESRLQELSSKSGRPPSDLIEDAMAGYLQELSEVRTMLDGRYDDLKSGRVKPVDGDKAFAKLRQKSKERRAGS